MGFLMDGLAAEAYDRSYSDRALIRRIWRYFRPHSGRVALVALMVVLGSLVATVIPITISRSIELLAGDPATQVLIGLAAIVAVMGALGWFFNFVRQTFSRARLAMWCWRCVRTPSAPFCSATCRSTTSTPRGASSAE